MEKENREYKDSVFVDLFYDDEDAGKHLLELYNALSDAGLEDENRIRKVDIGQVLYKNFKNDISFEVDGKVIVFGEHQSTKNENMPLRCLMYAGRAYEQLVDDKVRYQTSMAKIPTPEFYVFYNGTTKLPKEQELRLSDAFESPEGRDFLELKVKVININPDKKHELLDKCHTLREYSQFVEITRKYKKEKESLKKAIRECIEKGILSDYLRRRGSEVVNMLLAEYSYETDIQVKQEEAWADGWKEGKQEGRQEGRQEALCDTIRNIMESLHLTVEEAMKVMKIAAEDQEILKKMI